MNRPDAKKLMNDIAETYKKGFEKIKDYWKESEEHKTIENGRERILAAIPPEKRTDTIHDMQVQTVEQVEELKQKWLVAENAFFELHGEDITADMNLLNEVVNPSLEQLKKLADKYFNKNMTMEQSILNFASGKDKYKSILALPRTQTTAERQDAIEQYDVLLLKPRFLESSLEPEKDSAFSYMNSYKPIMQKALEKIKD